MFCHGSIYFCGFVTIGGEVCSAKDAPKLALGVATKEEYAEEIAHTEVLRQQIRVLESEVG